MAKKRVTKAFAGQFLRGLVDLTIADKGRDGRRGWYDH